MIDIGYFKAIQGAIGSRSKTEAKIREEQRRLSIDLIDSVNLVKDAKRNGVYQKIIVTPGAESYKCNVMAFPGEDLFTGDLLEFKGHHWIVIERPSSSVMQFSGVAWECNHLFKFQTFDGNIVERWGVIDSGQYSTDVYNGTMLTYTNSQYRLYMQYDDSTREIFIDKRLAVAKITDQNGKQILDVYKVTDVDPVTQSYGGGHLLALRAVSDAYDPMKDSIEHMICDYVSVETESHEEQPAVTILGDDKIRAGFSRQYKIDAGGLFDEQNPPINILWSIDFNSDKVRISSDGANAIVFVERDVPIGTKFSIQAECSESPYAFGPVVKIIEVVGIL